MFINKCVCDMQDSLKSKAELAKKHFPFLSVKNRFRAGKVTEFKTVSLILELYWNYYENEDLSPWNFLNGGCKLRAAGTPSRGERLPENKGREISSPEVDRNCHTVII